MPLRLSSICMSSPLPFDVCAFPFNVVSTVVQLWFVKEKLRSCEEGWMGPLSGHYGVELVSSQSCFAPIQFVDALFFVSLLQPMKVGIVYSVGYLFVNVFGIRGIGGRCRYLHST